MWLASNDTRTPTTSFQKVYLRTSTVDPLSSAYRWWFHPSIYVTLEKLSYFFQGGNDRYYLGILLNP